MIRITNVQECDATAVDKILNDHSIILFHLRKKFVEIRNGFDAFIKIYQIKFFVWRMKVIAV